MNETVTVNADDVGKIVVIHNGQAYKLNMMRALGTGALTAVVPKVTAISIGDVFMQASGTDLAAARPVLVTGSLPPEYPGRSPKRTIRLLNETGLEPYSDVPDMTRLETIDWLNAREMVLVDNVYKRVEKLMGGVISGHRNACARKGRK